MATGVERAILITGASTGIGAACAQRFAAAGHQVFAGVRKLEDGERLVAQCDGSVSPVVLDVTCGDTIAAAVAQVQAARGAEGISGIVNNAGVAVAGPIEFLPLERLRYQLEVNTVGQVAVTQAFMPLLRQRGGRIVFMSSMAGYIPTPYVGAYGASKHAIEAIADVLRFEVRRWNIGVSLVEPGVIQTPIWEKSESETAHWMDSVSEECAALYGGQLGAFRRGIANVLRKATPMERVVNAVQHALVAKRPKTRYVVGMDARMGRFAAHFLPDRMRDWLIARALGLPYQAVDEVEV